MTIAQLHALITQDTEMRRRQAGGEAGEPVISGERGTAADLVALSRMRMRSG